MNAHGWGYVSRALIGQRVRLPDATPERAVLADAQRSTTERARGRGRLSSRADLPRWFGAGRSDLARAPAIGRLWKSDFRLLRILSPSYSWAQTQIASADNPQVDQATAAASAYLDVVAQPIRAAALRVETRVVTGRNIAADILHEADASRCDWIAISTHGRGGLSRLLLGSVADKVVRGAHTPVLVYHPAA